MPTITNFFILSYQIYFKLRNSFVLFCSKTDVPNSYSSVLPAVYPGLHSCSRKKRKQDGRVRIVRYFIPKLAKAEPCFPFRDLPRTRPNNNKT